MSIVVIGNIFIPFGCWIRLQIEESVGAKDRRSSPWTHRTFTLLRALTVFLWQVTDRTEECFLAIE